MSDEFSLYWWDREGGQHEELRYVSAETVVKRAHSLANGPASVVLGIVKRIMITDGGDTCVFEWTSDAGVIHGVSP